MLLIILFFLFGVAFSDCTDETYKSASEGTIAYAACPDGYYGYRFALCSEGFYINENLTHCQIRETTLLSYGLSSIVLYVNRTIDPFVARSDGQLSNYTIQPQLPHGLSFSPLNGEISGIPTVLSDETQYEVQAQSGEQTLSTSVTISVVYAPCLDYETFPGVASGEVSTSLSACPENYEGIATRLCTNGIFGAIDTSQCQLISPSSLVYSPNEVTYLRHEPVVLTPTWEYIVTAWSIDPPLPPGLELESQGVISGVLEVVQSESEYTITASNDMGNTTATIRITVTGASCSGLVNENGVIETVAHNSYLYESCLSGFVGHGKRLCTDGVFGDVSYEDCHAIPPEDFGYAVSEYSLNQNETIATGRPFYRNRILEFSISPSLPEGMMFNTSTGEIVGNTAEIFGRQEYSITGSNEDTFAVATVQIEVHLPFCQSTEEFQSVPIGESSTVECVQPGYSGYITRHCELVNGKAQWSLPDSYCERIPNYINPLVAGAVCFICICVLSICCCYRRRRKVLPVTTKYSV